MNFDFDTVYDRHDTNSLKWDFYTERHHSPDELPMWVADMDFKSPRPMLDALHEAAGRGFFGYTTIRRSYPTGSAAGTGLRPIRTGWYLYPAYASD